jgi:DNA-binding transcriptional LysR family regulator
MSAIARSEEKRIFAAGKSKIAYQHAKRTKLAREVVDVGLYELRTLVAIAEQGSFAGAARALDLSQSTISTQMRALESEFGSTLFDRSKRPPALNEAGTLVVARARDLIGRYEELQSELAPDDAVQGRLRLGAVGSTLTGLLPAVLTAIRDRHPNLHVEIVSGFSQDLLRQVGTRVLDAAIISDYDSSLRDIDWRPFLRERLVLIAPPDAREHSARRLTQAYPFIRYSPNAAVGRIIDAAIRHARLDVRETMRLDWLEAIEAMVSHGHGISIVPERKFQGHSPLALQRIGFGSHHRTLGVIEPTSCRRRKLTDVLFGQLMVLVRQSAKP